VDVKIKIGVMGSATGNFSRKVKEASYEPGFAIAKNDCISVTGACPGLPLEAARGASESGGLVVGVSPGLSEWEHINKYDSPLPQRAL
jgi:predicted Rossmann-fold nucleotide-binding protein